MEYPHSGLSHPPPGVWCAERVHQHQPLSVWHSGDASGFLPLPPVPSAPAARVIGDTPGSLLQRMGPTQATVLCTVRSGYTLQFGWNPPRFNKGSPDSSKKRLEGFCATAGTFLPPTKGSNCGSASVAPETRLFQPLLPCTKVGRQSTTHSGPASSEPLPLQREVQDVDVEDYYVPDSSGRLDCHCRPEGCPIFTFRLSGGTGSSFGLLLEERLTSTRFFPLAWPWSRGLSQVHGCCSGPFEPL